MGIGTQLFKVFTIASVLERYGSVKGLHNLLFVHYMLESIRLYPHKPFFLEDILPVCSSVQEQHTQHRRALAVVVTRGT